MNVGSTTVTSLKTYRLALRAKTALIGLMHEPPWLLRVRVELDATGAPLLAATVTNGSVAVRMCFPASVDGIPVVVREVARPSGSGRCP
jgi:hypothetical protein